MSSLWTPGGEHPVEREGGPPRTAPPAPGSRPEGAASRPGPAPAHSAPDMEDLQRQLLAAPPEIVVANHAFGLFELAALHLSQEVPDFVAARLAIDAMGALVEGLAGRLGEPEADLVEGLAQIRLAFVQVSGARQA